MKPESNGDLRLIICYYAIASIFTAITFFLLYLLIFDIPQTEKRLDALNQRILTLQREAVVYDLNQPQYADIRKLIRE